MRIAVTRPEDDAGPLLAKLKALGHQAIAAPMMTIKPRLGVSIPALDFQAIAVTSANGIRALRQPERLKSLRILTVGPQSLEAALALGFRAEAQGGDVNGLAAFIRSGLDPADGPILYLSGAETAGDLEAQIKAAGFGCHRAVLYDAIPAQSLGDAGLLLRSGTLDAALLYSPRTARIWHQLVSVAGLHQAATGILHLCLSRNVAAVLPEVWKTATAASPGETAMLALLEHCR